MTGYAGRMGRHMAALATLTLLAGCAAQVPEARVTRFHLNQPLARGQIAVEPRNPAAASGLQFEGYRASVLRALQTAGFTVAPDLPRSELVAVVEVSHGSRVVGPTRSPVSIGIGGGTGGGGFGIGGGISFPIGKGKAAEASGTELFVQIKRRSEGSVIWEGRAQLEARAGTPYASPAAAVDRLATALFKDFPGESGRTITVK